MTGFTRSFWLRGLVWLGLVLVMLSGSAVSRAQTVTGQLVLLAGGDLWTLTTDGQVLTRQTTWTYNQTPALSPDGAQVAYASWAREAVEAGLQVPGAQISNIWLMDLNTSTFRRTAAQPDGATPETGLVRSNPVWSPDGTQLAWEELIDFQSGTRLVVQTLATGELRTVAEGLPLGFQDGGIRLPTPGWGASVSHSYVNYVDGAPMLLVDTVDLSGARQEFVIGNYAAATGAPVAHFWVGANGGWALAAGDSNGQWRLLDTLTGSWSPLAQAPIQVATTGSTALRLTVAPTPVEGRFVWRVLLPDGLAVDLPNSGWVEPALAADGQTVAYVDANRRLQLWRNGGLVTLPAAVSGLEVDAVLGSPAQWTLDGVTITPAEQALG